MMRSRLGLDIPRSFAVVAALSVLLPALAVCAGASLWQALDFSWLLLAVVALAHASFRPRSGCWRAFLTLTVALILLFPIISPDDDLLLFSVPDTAQTVAADAAKQKHVAAPTAVDALVASPASLLVPLRASSYLVFDCLFPSAVTPVSPATGNHSPPSC